MATWNDTLDAPGALLSYWNGSRGGIVRAPMRVIADPSYVPSMCFLLLRSPMTDVQRAALKELLMSDELDDATRLARLALLRSLLVDLELEGGVIAPDQLKELPNREWRFYQECKLRCDEKPVPVEQPE